ncbi:MAG: sugar phosphate isomerase/epimerase [Armatimonadetes bacterium]|nr:sugar phosphate isomerase/epimerase [Armatimonadota bacterium]
MKFGLIHYNAPGATLEEFINYAADTGFDGVELQIGDVWDEKDPGANPERKAEAARAMIEGKGLFVGALAAGNNFLVTDPEVVKAQVARMERCAKLALLLGANVIRSEGGWAADDSLPKERYALTMANCFRRCVPFLEELGVTLGVDNHGVVTNDADLQMATLGLVGSKFVGTTMDTMNYRWMGWDLPTCNRFYEMSSMRCMHLHLKDGTGSRGEYKGCELGAGEIDLAHAVRCLKANGYQGLWCAEYEGRDADGYTRCLKWMKANVPGL